MARATQRIILAVATAGFLFGVGLFLGVLAAGAFAPTVSEPVGLRDPERNTLMAWFARGVLVLALAWVVIGMLAARTRLVARPGAAAARASWLASTRPWRARESTLGMLELDRWLMFAVPLALLIATRLIEASFVLWMPLLLTAAALIPFAVVLRLFIWRRSPWPAIAAAGGVVVLQCVVELAVIAVAGPEVAWTVVWAAPATSTLVVAVGVALFGWLFIATGWAIEVQIGARRAAGAVLAAFGAGLAVPAVILGFVGIRFAAATAADVELLPAGLARVLDAIALLPGGAPWIAAGAAVVTAAVGVLLARMPEPERLPVP